MGGEYVELPAEKKRRVKAADDSNLDDDLKPQGDRSSGEKWVQDLEKRAQQRLADEKRFAALMRGEGRDVKADGAGPGGEYACDLCDYTTNSRGGIGNHRRKTHQLGGVKFNRKVKKLVCPMCATEVGKIGALLDHYDETGCQRQFDRFVKNGLGLNHPATMRKKADRADAVLKAKEAIAAFKASPNPNLSLLCEPCMFLAKNARSMNTHLQHKHPGATRCGCGAEFADQRELFKHMKNDHNPMAAS